MARDAEMMRGERRFVFTNLKAGIGLEPIAAFIVSAGGLDIEGAVSG